MKKEPNRLTDFEIGIIGMAIEDAVERHPVFCESLTSMTNEELESYLDGFHSMSGTQSADEVITEEMIEAILAYKSGDYRSALDECGHLVAVSIRLMRLIRHEAYTKGVFK